MSKKKPPKLPVPTESEEQQLIFEWATIARLGYPELEMLFHVPNEGKRSPKTGARLKREGLKRGVPDLCLPVGAGRYNALFIELKRRDLSMKDISEDQKEWIRKLLSYGNGACICFGADDAIKTIEEYLNMRRKQK